MKQREFEKCMLCGDGMMKGGDITFYRVNMERFIVDLGAIKRQHGLEIAMGSSELAAVMGPDEDLAKNIGAIKNVFICETCAIDSCCLAAVFEEIETKKTKRT
jgi:hypothetical protein